MIYGSACDFRDYVTKRGMKLSVDLSEITDDSITSALLVSSEWIDSTFGGSFIGDKDDFNQERQWPRKSAQEYVYPYHLYSDTDIPEKLLKAVYEATFRVLGDVTYLQKDYTPNPYASVAVTGAVSVTYNKSVVSASDAQIQIPVVYSLLSDLMTPDAQTSTLSGEVTR